MKDEGPEQIMRRILACVAQAQVNAANCGGDNATAASDIMCAFVLMARRSGADPDLALERTWEHAKAAVADFWPDETIN